MSKTELIHELTATRAQQHAQNELLLKMEARARFCVEKYPDLPVRAINILETLASITTQVANSARAS